MNGSKSLNSARAFRGLSGDPSGQRVHKVAEGGAGTNYRFRVANHHVLDTLLGQTYSSESHLEAIWWPWRISWWCGLSGEAGARRRTRWSLLSDLLEAYTASTTVGNPMPTSHQMMCR